MGDLADVDPVALARTWLMGRPRVIAVLGGARFPARNEPPYPCVRLTDPPGDDRSLTHLLAPLVQVEVLGDVDGTPGKPVLRRILYTVLQELTYLPDQEFGPGEVVVTSVTASGGGGFVPEPNGQPRYIATVRMHAHPPTVPAV